MNSENLDPETIIRDIKNNILDIVIEGFYPENSSVEN